jgi:mannose-6-phosphate isomerase class I
VVTCIDGRGVLATDGGALPLVPMQTALLPAVAGAWRVRSDTAKLELLVAYPQI